MASVTKHVRIAAPAIEPDLKEFIDEVLVPMLVRDALQEGQTEIHVAPKPAIVGQSGCEGGKL